MNPLAIVAVHASQFPEKVRDDLLESLRSRKIAHKFHYDSVKQTQKWLALHQQYSPSRNDAACRNAYENSFKTVARQVSGKTAHVIGLGCGGGQKDTALIKKLKVPGRKVFYTPCDVATAMVLTARRTALSILPENCCLPLVCDLQNADDLPPAFNLAAAGKAVRVITFFGMIPNFEPQEIMPKLASLVRRGDFLLFSANLAPGENYAEGVRKILPQYDNGPTRDWLTTFLWDLGIERADGGLSFGIETGNAGLKRVVAGFKFQRTRQIRVHDKSFTFRRGQVIRLFFSYRYTPERIRTILARRQLRITEEWILDSEEEGIFLCRKT